MRVLRWLSALWLYAVIATPANAVGFQYLSIPDGTGRSMELGIWYPSRSIAVSTTLAHVDQVVAVDGDITGDRLPLVVLSHGSAGWFGDRADTALALADSGFIAVALTHPGDNYRDDNDRIVTILLNRPRQISRVLDYVTASWPGRAHIDDSRIGFYGFSAGGYTGLVDIGGVPDWALFPLHCAQDASEGVCGQGAAKVLASPKIASHLTSERYSDPRIKAAALASPGYAFVFDPASLGTVNIPVALWGGTDDKIVPYESNVSYLERYLPHVVAAHLVRGAGHYSFLHPCSESAKAAGVEICADRPDFDRQRFQTEFNADLVRFFGAALANGGQKR